MYTELAVWFLSSLEMLTEAGTLCVCVCVPRNSTFSFEGNVYDCSNLYNFLYSVKIHHLSCASHVKLYGELTLADVWLSADTLISVSFSC